MSMLALDRFQQYGYAWSEGVQIPDFHKGSMMATLVKIQRKGQVTIPTRLRAQLGLTDGDVVEASAHRGRIVLTPKPHIDREYSSDRRQVIDARLAKAEADVKAGRVSKAYSDHREFTADLHKAAAKLTPQKD
ncbi:MAG: AbrB/MazE/SpoVT family DNA-binding domain-containing protein [Terriglobia bacterium]